MARAKASKRRAYTIGLPSGKVNFSVRGRKKPRKARLHLIKQIQDLIKKGKLIIEFDENGIVRKVREGPGKHVLRREKLSLEEDNLIQQFLEFNKEPIYRKKAKGRAEEQWRQKAMTIIGKPVTTEELKVIEKEVENVIGKEKLMAAKKATVKEELNAKRINASLKEHERRGQFKFIEPEVEAAEGYNKDITENLKKQLRYFQAVLKRKKKEMMTVAIKKESNIYRKRSSETRVTLRKKNVVRVTATTLEYRDKRKVKVIDITILKPDGKIFVETFVEEPGKPAQRTIKIKGDRFK
jgi:hypothetical protein